jgi:ferritin-like metal-binding protein YciE
MKVQTLEQFYVEEIQDLYDAEKQLLRALPRMAKAASHDQLKSAFEKHTQQTEEQAKRLERILQNHGKNSRGRRCKAMVGLIEEGKEMMEEGPSPKIMDVGLITTAQKVEHYEIAGYGCTSTYAKLLGFKDDLALLIKTLAEEKAADEKLTQLAKSIVNPAAEAGEPEAGEEDDGQARGRSARTQARAAESGRGQKTTARQSQSRSSKGSRSQAKSGRQSTRGSSARARSGSGNGSSGSAKATSGQE